MATEKKLIKDNKEECVLVPETDIYETENEYMLKLEMPGVEKEDLHITLDNNELEIRGELKKEEVKDMELKYAEYALHDYYRKFKVGNDVDRNGIKATLDNGILTLSLQKREEVKPKKIAITVN